MPSLNQGSKSDIYPTNHLHIPVIPPAVHSQGYFLREVEVLDTNPMTDRTRRRWQRQELVHGAGKEGERRVLVKDALSWNLASIPLIEHELDRVQHAYSRSFNPHVYTAGNGIDVSHSGYSPHQSVPRDVSSPSGSFFTYMGNEGDENAQDVAQEPEATWTADFASERVIAKEISDSTLFAIDPGCIRSLVEFDYSCLDELDDELILRPRIAFAELCWATVSNLRTPSKNPIVSHSPKPISYSAPPRVPVPSVSFTPSVSFYSHSSIEASSSRENPNVEVFSVCQPELDDGSETDNSSNTTISWTSIEEPNVMMVTGHRSMTTLDRFGGSKVNGSESDIFFAASPAESIPAGMKGLYHYRHDNSADSHLTFSRTRYDRSDDLRIKRQLEEADADSFISFDSDQDTSIPIPVSRSNYTHTHTNPHAGSYVIPTLHAYAGVAKPQESVGFFPIPASKRKATRTRSSPKTSSRYVGSLGSSVSKFCHAAFPLPGRVLKR